MIREIRLLLAWWLLRLSAKVAPDTKRGSIYRSALIDAAQKSLHQNPALHQRDE